MTFFRAAPGSLATLLLLPVTPFAQTQLPQGVFQGSTDIGSAQRGLSTFDTASNSYEVSGGGDDVWGTADAFRYTWKRVAGDVTLAADVKVAQPGTFPKAKGMLMIRQSLEPGSPYVDVAVHADGHVTLQYRLQQGGETKDTDLPGHGDLRLQIARTGDRYTASVLSGSTEPSTSVSVNMQGTLYVGLGACSHSVSALQKVVFSHVVVTPNSSLGR